ncbi:MAG: MBL fold metallo-hydrolase [Thermoplasmatota archaeon]
MVEQFLPPVPKMKEWKGDVFRVSVMYSFAGISTSIFLDHPNGTLVLDCGDGAVRDMIEVFRVQLDEAGVEHIFDLGKAGNRIDAVIISHAHFDHYSGILTMLEFLQLLGRNRPLSVIYPSGARAVEDLVDHFVKHLWESPCFDLDLIPVGSGDLLNVEGTTVETFRAVHRSSRPGLTGPPIDALSFRLTRKGEVISYSGDTSDKELLRPVVKDADLAIIEATFPNGHNDASGVHLTRDQALSAGSLAKDHMLIHFTAASYRDGINPGTREV